MPTQNERNAQAAANRGQKSFDTKGMQYNEAQRAQAAFKKQQEENAKNSKK